MVSHNSRGCRLAWAVESDGKSFVVGRENPVDNDIYTQGGCLGSTAAMASETCDIICVQSVTKRQT